ncbi:protein PAF1 homolog isoform X1 [Olea europaea var. sylvestris]|uniref:protein PAF1 homolog isoform X1 n=1 Tax=Olea europaea var. sylvestris TaxID=158386 RepID=UPI000C1CD842|nr:protein PAF1 homolog isoform X1 [Olea europaea var. sylvestris]
MASYRPFHPPAQSTIAPPPTAPPNQITLQPPAPPPHGNQYPQNWDTSSGKEGSAYNQNFAQMNLSSNYQHAGYGSSSQQHFSHPVPPPPQQQPFQYQPPPPPPSESSSYPPPPPPSSMPPLPVPAPPTYYPDSQFNQPQPLQPPPPPPPPSSPPLPPPPPSQPSSPPPLLSTGPSARLSTKSRHAGEKSGHGNLEASSKQKQKPPLPHTGPVQRSSRHGQTGKAETEEERRLRKKREYERLRQEEKHKQHLKESQTKVLQKTQILATGVKGHGSISGSHMGDRSTPLLSGNRIENRLKKPTTFVCKMKFWNELPDPSAKMKLLTLRRDRDRYVKYTITSLEKNHKPQLYVEPDLGIPLDLLDLSVYNPPKGERPSMDPEDEEILHEDVPITPIKKDGIKRKARPTEKGVSWLVKTQYISPLSTESTKQSLTEKQAKELRESRGGLNILDNLNSRKGKIQNIETSFKACKSKPVHAVNCQLQPRRILPLIPYFERYEDQFAYASFDSAPTADSEIYSKLNAADRDEHERCAIMKSFMASSSSTDKPDKFLAYMVPSVGELKKDMHDENEDITHSWIREYHWDVRGDDVDDPTTYLVAFGDSEAKYLPLPTKLILRKKRAREGKSGDEVEHFPVPKRVTVRKRSQVAVRELKDIEQDYVASNGRLGVNGKGVHHSDVDDQDTGGEDYISE